VSVTLPPAQNVVAPEALTVVVGSGFTVTVVADDVTLQPFAFVTVTEYVPVALTLIDCVDAPLLQAY
jgi:hypothetical protein